MLLALSASATTTYKQSGVYAKNARIPSPERLREMKENCNCSHGVEGSYVVEDEEHLQLDKVVGPLFIMCSRVIVGDCVQLKERDGIKKGVCLKYLFISPPLFDCALRLGIST